MLELPDPRLWPRAADATAAAAALYARVDACLSERETRAAEAHDAAIDAALSDVVSANDGDALAALLDGAPSAAIHRHLRRRLGEVERASLRGATLAVALFALPTVIVAARERDGDALTLAGTLSSPQAIADLLRDHDALGGNVQFALSGSLAGADALDLRVLPALIAHGRAALEDGAIEPLALSPQPVRVEGTQEGVHLRFVVGSALCGPQAELLGADESGKWSLQVARAISRDLAHPGVTVLALPRPPQRLVPALAAGRAAQRDIALQLFVGNALRRMRARVGEPIAVLSAHRAADAPGGGELRLALSSPFAPRDAEGFRYRLQRYERVPDAVTGITALLRDCRVADVRSVAEVLPDRDAASGVLRFGRPDDAAPPGPAH
jgi:hypothetical protein